MSIFNQDKKKTIEARLVRAREEGRAEAEIQCQREAGYKLEEQKNMYELELSDLKAQLISAKIEKERILSKYEVSTKKQYLVRMSENKLKHYAAEVFTSAESMYKKIEEGFQDFTKLKGEIDSMFTDNEIKLLENKK